MTRNNGTGTDAALCEAYVAARDWNGAYHCARLRAERAEAEADELRAERDALMQHAEAMAGFLAVFLGSDERFQPMIGGNPKAIDELLTAARQALTAWQIDGRD